MCLTTDIKICEIFYNPNRFFLDAQRGDVIYLNGGNQKMIKNY